MHFSIQNTKISNKNEQTHVFRRIGSSQHGFSRLTCLDFLIIFLVNVKIEDLASFSTKGTKSVILLVSTLKFMFACNVCHHACLFENTPLEENLFIMRPTQNANCRISHHPHIEFWGHKLNILSMKLQKKAPQHFENNKKRLNAIITI